MCNEYTCSPVYRSCIVLSLYSTTTQTYFHCSISFGLSLNASISGYKNWYPKHLHRPKANPRVCVGSLSHPQLKPVECSLCCACLNLVCIGHVIFIFILFVCLFPALGSQRNHCFCWNMCLINMLLYFLLSCTEQCKHSL